MCMGIPLKILTVDGIAALASNGERTEVIDLSLTGPLAPGTWILTHLGTAREVLDADEAARISIALAGLASLMRGGSLGDAFADLEARPSRLPPHLQAALDAGKTTA